MLVSSSCKHIWEKTDIFVLLEKSYRNYHSVKSFSCLAYTVIFLGKINMLVLQVWYRRRSKDNLNNTYILWVDQLTRLCVSLYDIIGQKNDKKIFRKPIIIYLHLRKHRLLHPPSKRSFTRFDQNLTPATRRTIIIIITFISSTRSYTKNKLNYKPISQDASSLDWT